MFNVDGQNTPIKDRCQNEFKNINHSLYYGNNTYDKVKEKAL